jgi:actin-like ATPase involved in cell morphogenesis
MLEQRLIRHFRERYELAIGPWTAGWIEARCRSHAPAGTPDRIAVGGKDSVTALHRKVVIPVDQVRRALAAGPA